MRRTQLYLDESLWSVLHRQARSRKTTVSDLVRQAVRERYMQGGEERAHAMRAIVGMWKDRPEFEDSAAYVREMRRDSRMARLKNL
ncbi:MAG TPA: ribbon-helix-helix protein, CopG family [Silvibacterium sp.]|nr:ribbon-helix-helix protein, CopG family [Silvibacterium sp.]